MFYADVLKVFTRIELENMQYSFNDQLLPLLKDNQRRQMMLLQENLEKKITILVTDIVQHFCDRVTKDYANANIDPELYNTYLSGFKGVIDNTTSIHCYQDKRFDRIRREILRTNI